MTETYSGHGVRFEYPADWDLDEQPGENQVMVTVTSPGTAFWSLALNFDNPQPEDVLQSVLDTFREEYEELDVYPSSETLADQPTLARDLDFVCHELLNCASVRIFEADEFTGLVLYQVHDRELDVSGPVLEAITRSLEWDAVQ